MKIAVLGGSGHVGSFLVPRLVEEGHDVVVVSRGRRKPYRPHGAWRRVTTVVIDREESEADGSFGPAIADLGADVVIDMICFREESARQLVEALAGRVQHFLHCGTIWVYGPSGQVPAVESEPRRPLEEYGRGKAEIEAYLLDQARRNGFPATVIHPGHITGPGWVPINPAGHLNLSVFQALADGAEVTLPNFGMETLHHVHADDVAQVFTAAMANRSAAVGESFHAVAPTALTLRGYAEAVSGWFGHEPRLAFLPWEQWRTTVDEGDAEATYSHIAHSPHRSMEKASRLLGHRPRYTALEAIEEAVDALVAEDRIKRRE
ncbi:NAD-dependent epimerase/dehydratase family protein [Streptomyces bathyalis]|uniref:NAD-dependent epimerase/dehydratase family protein n=1 Tax=Streptomyces bathyalis TaxID=2710756 RepID=A0A7T1T879_9ACTN|nr:NAD-dependent epimerase/dehydratase family protein [Streptomyces bathyalis]QPP08189.1 NAD-dependent epimerase/dehydratase family protein [Streptomyces bathyalis]